MKQIQNALDETLIKNTANGYNVFCKELIPAQKQSKPKRKTKKQKKDVANTATVNVNVNISFDESYFDDIHIHIPVSQNINNNVNVKCHDQFLCWICGDMFASNQQLVQHASDLHFYDWMAANSFWELTENYMLRY